VTDVIPPRPRAVVAPGAPARPSDADSARALRRLLRDELPRVRAAAAAWRNGLAGLLAVLAGFGLIRGRNDVGQVARPWDGIVGGLLILALAAGAAAAVWMLRAANGPPRMTPVSRALPAAAADHVEARSAVQALRRGIAAALCCAGLLAAAVGTTWYGPARDEPQLELTAPDTVACGAVIRVESGTIVLDTASGEIAVPLATVRSLRPVASCP
jgi:hypothetical protein